MKRSSLIALLLGGFAFTGMAKDGYKIQIKFKDLKDSTIYLAHYFAKPLPTIYKSDSAKVDKNGNAVFSTTKKFTGGMFMIMLSDKKSYFEMVLNNGDDMTINVNSIADLPSSGVTFKNSPENEDFVKYEAFVRTMGEKHQRLNAELSTAKNSVDSAAVKEEMKTTMQTLMTYRADFVKDHPNALLAKVFRALDPAKVPEGKHLLPDGKEDVDFAYRYYKAHFWDNFDLKDGRMINTPVYDARLEEYFDKLVIPVTDSVIKEADWILGQTKGTGDLFNYTLSWLANYGQGSKIMGMDKVYVYLVQNYYMKGDATWLSSDLLEKHIQQANDLSTNLIGNVGYDITMPDTSGKKITVSAIKSKYKLLVIWDPTCGHCMKEIPEIDSVYKAENLKAKGLKIIGICSEINDKAWKEFIAKHKLDQWIHISDPEHRSNYKAMYNARTNPTMFMLDEKGIIRGKGIDHSNLSTLVDMLTRQDAEKEKKGSK